MATEDPHRAGEEGNSLCTYGGEGGGEEVGGRGEKWAFAELL